MHPFCDSLVLSALIVGIVLGHELRVHFQIKNNGVHKIKTVNCSVCGQPSYNVQFTTHGLAECDKCRNR